MHGEAYLAPWKLVSSDKQGTTTTAKFTVDLPQLQETFTRQFRIVDGESVRYSGGLGTPVRDGAEIFILPAVSGG